MYSMCALWNIIGIYYVEIYGIMLGNIFFLLLILKVLCSFKLKILFFSWKVIQNNRKEKLRKPRNSAMVWDFWCDIEKCIFILYGRRSIVPYSDIIVEMHTVYILNIGFNA